MEDPMEGLLAELRSQGTLDSEGLFTIDLTAARERLRHRQLPDRCFYILKWVQSAVAARAGAATVHCSPTRVAFTHDGRPPSKAFLSDLLGSLLDPSRCGSAELDLATGVNVALGFPGSSLVIQAGGPQGSVWLELDQEQARFGESRPLKQPRTMIVLERSLGWSALLSRTPPEVAVLRERAGFAPLRLEVDGNVVDPRFGAPLRLDPLRLYFPGQYVSFISGDRGLNVRCDHHALSARLIGEPAAGRLNLGPCRATRNWLEDGRGHFHLVTSPESFESSPCWAGLGMRADLRNRSALRLVRFGVVLQTLTDALRRDGLEGVMSCDDLRVDLSEFSLAQEPPFEARLARLQAVQSLFNQHLRAVYAGSSNREALSLILVEDVGAHHALGP